MNHPRSEILSPAELNAIHETSMAIMSNVGVAFHSDEAISMFSQHGARTDGRLVFLDEKQVMEAIGDVPARFTIRARNPEKNVVIGGKKVVFAPGYGAPYIMDPEQGRRKPSLTDYRNLIRLANALPNQDMSGHLLVQPADVPENDAHLHMIHIGMLCSDKPFIGSSEDAMTAEHTMEMATILFDELPEKIREQPVTAALVNCLSPLSYSEEMSGALMAYARWRQPVILAALVMAGATGPITLAGMLAQQNAELLAGIVLAQMINPGTPVIYASASTNMDMRTGTLAIGSPELSLASAASIQIAHHYGIPSRGGGALTDANSPDAQAGFESMFTLLTAAQSGASFVLHAAGILSSFLAFSYEKFVLDDEMCGMVRRFLEGIAVTPETLAYDVIASVGAGGSFLGEFHTVERCREAFWQPSISTRHGPEKWLASGRPEATQRARLRWQALLAGHEDPGLDFATTRQLSHFVEQHSN